jgi:hypothetical protein
VNDNSTSPTLTAEAWRERVQKVAPEHRYLGGSDVRSLIDDMLAALARPVLSVTEPERCIACDEALQHGEMVMDDASGGIIHARCCGPERESYTGPDGEPLKDGEPIPQGWPWVGDDLSEAELAEYAEGLATGGGRHVSTMRRAMAEIVRRRAALRTAAPAEAVAWLHNLTGIIRTDKPYLGLDEDYTPLYAAPPVAGEREKAAPAELAKIAESLGCGEDPFAAWETLEVVLSALRFYADHQSYVELPADEAETLAPPNALHCMIDRACLTSGTGRLRVEVPVGNAVPLILSDWGDRARASLPPRSLATKPAATEPHPSEES